MKRLIILFAIILYIGFPNNLFSQVHDDIYNNPIQRTEKLDSANSTAKTYRKPSKATLLSLAYPGVGQYYNGQKDKAIGFIAWKVASDVCMIFGFYGMNILLPLQDKGFLVLGVIISVMIGLMIILWKYMKKKIL